MIARSTPTLRDVNATAAEDTHDFDADSARDASEPVRPADASRSQLLALVPSPALLATICGGLAAAVAGGAVGYWLGRRHAPKPVRSARSLASTVDSAMDLAPVAMHLLGNPLVRAVAIRILLRQIGLRAGR